MNYLIKDPLTEFIGDRLKGAPIRTKSTRLADLKGVFSNEATRQQLPGERVVYEVEVYLPVPDGSEGELFFGITKIQPGHVGEEYHITRGHFHAISNRGEFYWCIKGEGMLILMDRDRNVWAERMYEGSLHYIPGHTAHRVANVGEDILSFGACWPSDAGHDYKEIADNGFAARLMNVNGVPQLLSKI